MNEPVTVGVLGGMGPAATADFFDRVLRATNATRDQDHLRLIIYNNPALPDRNEAIAGRGPSPGPALAEMARSLSRAGADVLVMPCNAAHAFKSDIVSAMSLPFIDMIEETAVAAAQSLPGIRRVGLLAANGCIAAGLYPNALRGRSIDVIVPQGARQNSFMALLYRIKSGDMGNHVRTEMLDIASSLVAEGAQALIAGCTEVPLVLRSGDLHVPIVASTDVLVERTIAYAKGLWSPSQ